MHGRRGRVGTSSDDRSRASRLVCRSRHRVERASGGVPASGDAVLATWDGNRCRSHRMRANARGVRAATAHVDCASHHVQRPSCRIDAASRGLRHSTRRDSSNCGDVRRASASMRATSRRVHGARGVIRRPSCGGAKRSWRVRLSSGHTHDTRSPGRIVSHMMRSTR